MAAAVLIKRTTYNDWTIGNYNIGHNAGVVFIRAVFVNDGYIPHPQHLFLEFSDKVFTE